MEIELESKERFLRNYPAGSVVFHEGEPGSEMYVIQAGRVQLTRRLQCEEKIIATLPPGEFFGEMAIVNQRPRSATATVIEDAQMLALDAQTFESMIRSSSEVAVRLIQRLANRLDKANRQIESLLVQDTNHRVVQALHKLAETHGIPEETGVRIDVTAEQLAGRLATSVEEIAAAVQRLEKVGLVGAAPSGQAFWVAEVGRLEDFLEFQELKQKFPR